MVEEMPKKEKQGVVISNKMEKTIVVKVASYNPHPKYKKIMESNKNYKAHDEKGICSEGDVVKIIEAKPVSGSKRWAVLEVLEKAK
ncbi:MAG: 30S ribosomal protein S17 [bacterium]